MVRLQNCTTSDVSKCVNTSARIWQNNVFCMSLWKLRMCHFGSSPKRGCVEKTSKRTCWFCDSGCCQILTMLHALQSSGRGLGGGENMAGVTRGETHQLDLIYSLPSFYLRGKTLVDLGLLGTLHCRTRENNWKNTLYTSYSHKLTKRFANQLSDVYKNVAATFLTDKFLLSVC